MPVRDVEAYFPSSPKRIRFLANRGANGIDGVLASAAGAALATGAPTTVLIGEIALLHDIGGLLAARRAGIDLTVVCLNNGGGAIFDFLPVAEHADPALYERHVATPSGRGPDPGGRARRHGTPRGDYAGRGGRGRGRRPGPGRGAHRPCRERAVAP